MTPILSCSNEPGFLRGLETRRTYSYFQSIQDSVTLVADVIEGNTEKSDRTTYSVFRIKIPKATYLTTLVAVDFELELYCWHNTLVTNVPSHNIKFWILIIDCKK